VCVWRRVLWFTGAASVRDVCYLWPAGGFLRWLPVARGLVPGGFRWRRAWACCPFPFWFGVSARRLGRGNSGYARSGRPLWRQVVLSFGLVGLVVFLLWSFCFVAGFVACWCCWVLAVSAVWAGSVRPLRGGGGVVAGFVRFRLSWAAVAGWRWDWLAAFGGLGGWGRGAPHAWVFMVSRSWLGFWGFLSVPGCSLASSPLLRCLGPPFLCVVSRPVLGSSWWLRGAAVRYRSGVSLSVRLLWFLVCPAAGAVAFASVSFGSAVSGIRLRALLAGVRGAPCARLGCVGGFACYLGFVPCAPVRSARAWLPLLVLPSLLGFPPPFGCIAFVPPPLVCFARPGCVAPAVPCGRPSRFAPFRRPPVPPPAFRPLPRLAMVALPAWPAEPLRPPSRRCSPGPRLSRAAAPPPSLGVLFAV